MNRHWRSAYLFAADIAFAEFEHCRRVHRDWQKMKPETREKTYVELY